jgi:hypothetical protein
LRHHAIHTLRDGVVPGLQELEGLSDPRDVSSQFRGLFLLPLLALAHEISRPTD